MEERVRPQEALNTIQKMRTAPVPEKKDWHCAVHRRPEENGVRDNYVFWVPDYTVPISHTQDESVDTFTFVSSVRATVVMVDGRAGELRERYTFMIALPDWFTEGSLTFEPVADFIVTPSAEPSSLLC